VLAWAESLRARGTVVRFELGRPSLDDLYTRLYDSDEGARS
jgi:hypothetical protein